MVTPVRYYENFDTDFVTSADQTLTLPPDYRWQQDKPKRAAIVYSLARLIGGAYCRLFLHVHVRGAAKVAAISGGAFIYANHTQPVGDAFVPMLASRGHRAATIAAPANLAVPVLGRLLKLGGALVLPDNLHQLGAFNRELRSRYAAGNVITVYPEAHVWPYATMIRPFAAGSMHYPVASNAPVFAMTTTYQHRRIGHKPRITVDVDGPFWPDRNQTRKQQQSILEQQVRRAMQNRACTQNTYEYVRYEPVRKQESGI